MLPEGYVENYEQIAKDYGVGVSTETVEISSRIRKVLAIGGFLHYTTGAKVLDVGCGWGYTVGKLHISLRVGLDISHTQCKYASHLFKSANFLQADAQEIPFKDNSFHAVICTDVFEHVPDEKLLVDEIHRILCDNGILFFACPFYQDLSYYDSPEYEKNYRYVHLRSVSRKLLEKRFSKFHLLHETMITSHMAEQKSPYPIIFQVYIKK